MAFWPQNASVFGNSVFIDPSGDTGVVRTYYCKASAMHTGLESRKLAKMLFVCLFLFVSRMGWGRVLPKVNFLELGRTY